jgi:hypothetical protein
MLCGGGGGRPAARFDEDRNDSRSVTAMKPRYFLFLAISALVATALAAITHANRQPALEIKKAARPLAPDLVRNVDRLSAIEVKQGDKSLTIERKGEAWSIKERGGYPAKADVARSLVARLAASEFVDPKTRVAANHGVLELEDPAGKDAKSRLVRLVDAKGAALTEIVVGKRKYEAFGPSRPGTYVREPKAVETWLATGDIDVPVDVRGWAQSGIVDLPADKITKVTIALAGEAPLTIEREQPGKYKLLGVPEGRKLKQGGLVDETARAAASVELDDVRKAVPAAASDKPSVITVLSEGGPTVKLTLRKDPGGDWLAVVAEGDGEARKAADAITARTGGWEYKIPAAKAGALLKTIGDFLEPKS